MAVLNKAQLIGHVGHSPKLFHTKENHPVASVSLATNESYRRNGEWESIAEWHHLVFFGKLATFAAERLQRAVWFILRVNYAQITGLTLKELNGNPSILWCKPCNCLITPKLKNYQRRLTNQARKSI